ncbi:hypothetical protein ABZ912_28395 [Nonomuraea angiospora]|uniref:PP2C family protein-serine/threonine phosphatase n=1 Tax=Nonomuraea angiospora TaxID=46172 RepID=UPI003408DFA4
MTTPLLVEPLVGWPQRMAAGEAYLVTVDLRIAEGSGPWEYDPEEFVYLCMLDGEGDLSVEAVDDAAVILHRFGGSYGPARFVVTAGSGSGERRLWLNITNETGALVCSATLPVAVEDDDPDATQPLRFATIRTPPPAAIEPEPGPEPPPSSSSSVPGRSPGATMGLRYALASDAGFLEEDNRDAGYASPHMFAVADGNDPHGALASAAAIEQFAILDTNPMTDDLLNTIELAMRNANVRLHDMVSSDPALRGIATSLTAMLWSGSQVALVHTGMTRAYLLRRGELFQITHDHTLVQSLVDEGRITQEEAQSHPQSDVLLRSLDGGPEVEPDLTLREAHVGDRYVLCTRGLWGLVSAEGIHNALTTEHEPEETVRRLIDLARRGGGAYNITCCVLDVVEASPKELLGQPAIKVTGQEQRS